MASHKRTSAMGFLVHVVQDADESEDVNGVDILVGEYKQCEEEYDGQPTYRKTLANGGSSDDPSDKPCCLYYCSGEDGDDENVGWWFGQDVGGSMVFCFARSMGFPPPATGWCIPAEEEIPVRCLRVTPLDEVGQVSKKARNPAPPPAPQRPWDKRQAGLPAAAESIPSEGQVYSLHLDAAEAQPVGFRLSCDVLPPLILEVRAGSWAAEKGVKPGFELQAVNGEELTNIAALERAKALLRQRPLELDVRDPGSAQRVHAIAACEPVFTADAKPGQDRRVAMQARENFARLVWGLSEEEACLLESLIAKVRAEKDGGAGRPIWSRLSAVAATLDKHG